MVTLTTRSAEETRRLGVFIGERLFPGSVVTLDASLGLGKTTLTKGLAEGVNGHAADAVTSPAFGLVNEYPAANGSPVLYHMDFYRLDTLEINDRQMLEEYLADDQAVVVMEWGERFVRQLVPSYLQIRLDFCGGQADDCRRVVVEAHGDERFSQILASLEARADAHP